MKSRRLNARPLLCRWAEIMAQQSHFRYAGRMAASHPTETNPWRSANDGKGATFAGPAAKVERPLFSGKDDLHWSVEPRRPCAVNCHSLDRDRIGKFDPERSSKP